MHIFIKMPTKTKQEKKLYEEIEIPEGIQANLEDNILTIKKENKEVKREINPLIKLKIENNKILINTIRNRKIERKLFGTFKAHIKNMTKGLEQAFIFKLKIANVHFPMNVTYDKTNNSLIIKNFLGEKKDRIIQLNSDVDVKVENEDITITSHDIEKAGTSATKIEKAIKPRKKDRRIYQDGIYIIQKPGRIYLE